MPLLAPISPLLATLALAGAAPSPAQPPVRYQQFTSTISQLAFSDDDEETPEQRRGQRIYIRVLKQELGSCTFTSYVPRATRRTPTAVLLAALPPLRRPGTPADRPPPELREQVEGLYVDRVRRVRPADGSELLIAPAVDRMQQVAPPDCMPRIRARLLGALAGQSGAARRAAIRMHRAMRAEYPAKLGPPVETVSLVAAAAGDEPPETIVYLELPRLLSTGAFATVPAAEPARSRVAGIVPAEVESVTLTLGRPEWNRASFPPAPLPLELTLPVLDNVVAAEVERAPEDAQVLGSLLHRPNASSHPEIRVIR